MLGGRREWGYVDGMEGFIWVGFIFFLELGVDVLGCELVGFGVVFIIVVVGFMIMI